MNKQQLTQAIKQRAIELGFMACGVSKAEELTEEARYLERWLNQQQHGTMQYMANHFDKRIDPCKLVDGAKSVISLSYNYFTPQTQPQQYKIAMYAQGQDYHDVVRAKLEQLMQYMREVAGAVEGRCFVDSAPVLERAWAQRSGVGWVGKNTNLLTKRAGSYYFLAEIISDLELEYDSPVKNYCGSCTKCIDACPTQAIYEPYKLDASKCISYLTIELKANEIPNEFAGKMEGWMYGCDICQQVCPINSQAQQHSEPAFNVSHALSNMQASNWEQLSPEQFKVLFKHSAVKRTKYSGLMRNIQFLKK